MRVKTEILQKMVTKAIQGSSFNKMIPLTSLIGIEVKGDMLTLTTTDGSNQLRISQKLEREPIIAPQEFYTIVNADTFSKLVGKTTKEFVELANRENYLEVIGNGTYKLEIAINEEGEMVRFSEIKNIEGLELSLNLENLQNQIKVAKASVAKTMEVPCLTGYYIAKNIIATDRQMVCSIENQEMEEPILISSEMAELLLLVEGSEILEIVKKDNDIIFYNQSYTIAGRELEGKEIYPVQPIENLVKLDYNNSIKVDKQELLNVLDRMTLFVTDYDKGGVYLVFDTEGLLVKSQKSNAVETIIIPGERATFECLADIEMLKAQIETISTEEVEIQYGQEKSIKIVDNNVIHIISLLDKTE